mmetsp:Transcript_121794/g.234896  ORF Transcript_121794/g.234896 Transcript_121794/m.234896 type:complete len:218 (+) Transcript_121794:1441-2094(+)
MSVMRWTLIERRNLRPPFAVSSPCGASGFFAAAPPFLPDCLRSMKACSSTSGDSSGNAPPVVWLRILDQMVVVPSCSSGAISFQCNFKLRLVFRSAAGRGPFRGCLPCSSLFDAPSSCPFGLPLPLPLPGGAGPAGALPLPAPFAPFCVSQQKSGSSGLRCSRYLDSGCKQNHGSKVFADLGAFELEACRKLSCTQNWTVFITVGTTTMITNSSVCG